MAYRDIRPFKSARGEHDRIQVAPMNASETFQGGELICINTDGEAQTFTKNGGQAVLAQAGIGTALTVGVAVNGPGAAADAAVPNNRAWVNPETGNSYATGDKIYYYETGPGQLFISRALVAGGASGFSTAVSGAARGIIYEITYENASTPDAGWGVELTAGSAGVDVLAKVVDVLDVNYKRVSATATDGYWVVFEILTNVS